MIEETKIEFVVGERVKLLNNECIVDQVGIDSIMLTSCDGRFVKVLFESRKVKAIR